MDSLKREVTESARNSGLLLPGEQPGLRVAVWVQKLLRPAPTGINNLHQALVQRGT